MVTPTVESVREEHEQFLPYLEDIRQVADSIGRVSTKHLLHMESELRRILYGLHALLTAHFAQAEDVFTAALEPERGPTERAELFEAVERSAQAVSDIYE